MSSLIAILSLVSALTSTSSALWCTQCSSYLSSSCTGISSLCPPEYHCGTSYTKNSDGGMTLSEVIIRSCILSSQCSSKGSISMKDSQIKMATACCNTDNCTPNLPALPTNSDTPNGVVCRSCVSAKSTWCYTSDTVKCTGDENMCLLQTSEVSGVLATAVRGCSTKSLCDLGTQSSSSEGKSAKVQFICTNGGTPAQKLVLTPAIVCLLLLKWFF